MSDANNNETASKAPSHIAYQVRDREGKKGFWTRIGSVWPHADGKGFNIQLEVVPAGWTHHPPRRHRKKGLTASTGRASCPPINLKGFTP